MLRLGMAAVFIWFAMSQFTAPQSWTSFLPGWVASLPVSATAFVLLNALFEMVLGVMLALGVWPRLAALFLSLHLFGIAATIGYNALGIRDAGLALATLALAIGGVGSFRRRTSPLS